MDVIAHISSNFNGVLAKLLLKLRMSNYNPHKIVDMITNPCSIFR